MYRLFSAEHSVFSAKVRAYLRFKHRQGDLGPGYEDILVTPELISGLLVARSGSLARRREALAVGDVIGWNLRATWFQRRLGLTTLVATTAGGRGAVTLVDVPVSDAVALANAALPGLAEQFLATSETDTPVGRPAH